MTYGYWISFSILALLALLALLSRLCQDKPSTFHPQSTEEQTPPFAFRSVELETSKPCIHANLHRVTLPDGTHVAYWCTDCTTQLTCEAWVSRGECRDAS